MDKTYFIINAISRYAGSITDAEIETWFETIKDNLFGDELTAAEGKEPTAFFCSRRSVTLTEVAPPDVKLIGAYAWDLSSNNWSNVVQTTDPYLEAVANRTEAYKTTDALRNSIEYDALSKGITPNLTPWVEAVAAVKGKYPLPTPAPAPTVPPATLKS